jgi:MFS family permease
VPFGWVLVVTLGLTETVSWGILYYAFGVFLRPMAADLGWSRAGASGAFTLATLLSGAAAVPAGRWLDRHGPRALMTAGSCAGTLLVLAWAGVRDLLALYLIWAGIGVAMAAVLYDPAFATVTAWFAHGRGARARALTAVTLMAGLASTIFVPLAAWLVQAQGWRLALVTLAAVLGAATIPLHALLLRRPPGQPAPGERTGGVAGGLSPGAVLRLPGFPWAATAFSLYYLAATGVGVHLVAYLTERGYGAATAAAATGLVGVTQVAGRLFFAPLEGRLPRRRLTALVLLVQPVALGLLLLGRGSAALIAFVVLFGASRGVVTLARATLVADRYGAARYASVAGVLTLWVTCAQAAGPLALGFGRDAAGSYDPALWALTGVALAAALAAFRAGRPESARRVDADHGAH